MTVTTDIDRFPVGKIAVIKINGVRNPRNLGHTIQELLDYPTYVKDVENTTGVGLKTVKELQVVCPLAEAEEARDRITMIIEEAF